MITIILIIIIIIIKNKCGETQKKWFKPILLIVTSSILFLVSIDWTYNGTWNGSTVSIDIGPYCQVFLTPVWGEKAKTQRWKMTVSG